MLLKQVMPGNYFTVITLCISVITVLAAFPLSYIYTTTSEYSKYLGLFTVTQFLLLTACMLGFWWHSYKFEYGARLTRFRMLIAVGIVLRLLLIPVDHYTSNDVDRYLFDGYIAFSGFDPYTLSHNSAEFADVIAKWAPPKEHLKYVTLYPPLAVALYSLAASAGHILAPLVWSIMIAATSITTLILGALILDKKGKNHHLPLLVLSPILIFEAGVGAHIDAFATLFITLALYYWQSHRHFLVGVMIGLGTLVKLFPLVIFGPMLLFLSSWKQRGQLSAGLGSCITLGYSTAFLVGWTPIGSISVFFEKFRFGSPVFSVLEQYLTPSAQLTTVVVLLLLGYAILAYYSLQAGLQTQVDKLYVALQLSLSLPLFFGPVVYPWYLMSLIPVLAIYPSGWLLVWSILLPLTYEVLSAWVCCQQWQPQIWPLVVITTGLLLSVLIFNKRNKSTFHSVFLIRRF